MFIKALTIEGIGRFGTAAHVDGFGEGVNVLAAGNEVGKSTLFKAIRTCLFCRHDSKIQEIRDLGSDGSQMPATVQLTFVRQGRTYVIKKSFLRSPSASLTEDGREIARSKQADEAVWDILGVGPGSGRALGRARRLLHGASSRGQRVVDAQFRHRIRSRRPGGRGACKTCARCHQWRA